jgi:hypothetical protein
MEAGSPAGLTRVIREKSGCRHYRFCGDPEPKIKGDRWIPPEIGRRLVEPEGVIIFQPVDSTGFGGLAEKFWPLAAFGERRRISPAG